MSNWLCKSSKAARLAEMSSRTAACGQPPVSMATMREGGNALWHLRQPALPSWGEPYTSIAERMLSAMGEAWRTADGGDALWGAEQSVAFLDVDAAQLTRPVVDVAEQNAVDVLQALKIVGRREQGETAYGNFG